MFTFLDFLALYKFLLDWTVVQTFYILDWDETLLCISGYVPTGIYHQVAKDPIFDVRKGILKIDKKDPDLENDIKAQAKSLIALFKLMGKNFVIVTNAQQDWVQTCIRTFIVVLESDIIDGIELTQEAKENLEAAQFYRAQYETISNQTISARQEYINGFKSIENVPQEEWKYHALKEFFKGMSSEQFSFKFVVIGDNIHDLISPLRELVVLEKDLHICLIKLPLASDLNKLHLASYLIKLPSGLEINKAPLIARRKHFMGQLEELITFLQTDPFTRSTVLAPNTNIRVSDQFSKTHKADVSTIQKVIVEPLGLVAATSVSAADEQSPEREKRSFEDPAATVQIPKRVKKDSEFSAVSDP